MHASYIFAEQIKLLFANTLSILVAHLIGGIVTVYSFRHIIHTEYLYIWFALLILMICLRLIAWLGYQFYKDKYSDRHWACLSITLAMFAGFIWGLGTIMFYRSGSIEHILFILFLVSVLANGSLIASYVYLPVYHGFALPLLVPIMIYLWWQPALDEKIWGLLPMAFLTIQFAVSRTLNKSFIDGLRLSFENITLIKELKQQKRQAEDANIAKSKFLAAASHDLRQPLYALSLFTGILDQKTIDEECRGIVDKIKTSVAALESLFNSLLDISRLDAGVIKPNIINFRLDELILQIANENKARAESKGLSFHINTGDQVVESDPVLLGIVIRNIVSNAIRYTEKGEVRLSCLKLDDSNSTRITIADTGIGIAPDQHQQIFREYYQINNPQRDREKGLGLGLAIVKRILDILHVPLYFESTLGKGTVFSMCVRHGLATQVAAIQNKSSHNIVAISKNILVIDDESTIREAIELLLTGWGCKVITCADGQQASAAILHDHFKPDIIITDYRLTNCKTGVDIIADLQALLDKPVPGIIITGDTAPEVLREATASGYQLLNKPVKPLKLKTLLTRL